MTYLNSEDHKANLAKARKIAIEKTSCPYCLNSYSLNNLSKHENSCYLNPINLKRCPVDDKPIKNYKDNQTCSYACANRLTKTGPNHGNWRSYQSICFFYHGKKCIVCGEEDIVAAHHYDENKGNCQPSNLIPLCPTHHTKFHSRYKYKVIKIIDDYLQNWLSKNHVIDLPYGRKIIHCGVTESGSLKDDPFSSPTQSS